MSKVQRWLHELALPKIDPETHLYISHTSESASYRSLWNYDYAAAPIPILFFSGLTSHTWWTEWVNREMAIKVSQSGADLGTTNL